MSSATPTDNVVVFVNAGFIFVLVMTGLFFAGLLTDLGVEEGTMRGAVVFSIFIFSDLAFAAIGLGLLIGGKHSPISKFNKLLPWIALFTITAASLGAIVAPFTDEEVTDTQVGISSMILCLILCGLTGNEMFAFSKRVAQRSNSDAAGEKSN
jgi:hypothetical protein